MTSTIAVTPPGGGPAAVAVAVAESATRVRSARARRVRRAVVIVAVLSVLGIDVVLFGRTFGGAANVLGRVRVRWVAVAVVAELSSVCAAALAQRVILVAGGVQLRRGHVYRLALAANALNITMPVGNGVSSAYIYTRLRTWGVAVPVAAFTVVTSGVLSLTAFLAISVSYAVSQDGSLLAFAGAASAALVVLALLVAALLIHRRRPAYLPALLRGGWSRTCALVHRDATPGLAAVDGFFRDLSNVRPRVRDWAAVVLLSAAYWLVDLCCLVACQRALGIGHLGLLAVTGAYLAGMGVAGLSLLPGGLGTVEAAMILVLVQSSVGRVGAAGLVLLYRLISVGLVGGLGWAEWTITRVAAARDVARQGRPPAGDDSAAELPSGPAAGAFEKLVSTTVDAGPRAR